MGSGGIFHKFWCDKCQCYVDFSDFETCESICEYCEATENKARAEAAEAEIARLRADLAKARADAEATRVAAARDRDRMRGNVNAWRDRAEAAEAEAERGEHRLQRDDMSSAIYANRVALLEQQLAESKAMADAVLSAAHAEYEASKENITAAQAERDTAIARGAAAERAAVVAWLQEVSASSLNWRPSLVYAARSIERGDHRKEE